MRETRAPGPPVCVTHTHTHLHVLSDVRGPGADSADRAARGAEKRLENHSRARINLSITKLHHVEQNRLRLH